MRVVAGPEWEALPAGTRRRLAMTEVLRSALVALIIVTGYFLVPMSGRIELNGIVAVLGALAMVAALLAWQIRGILRSPYPGATAVGGLMVSVPLFLVTFASVYFVMAFRDPDSWSEPLTKLDALYFTVTVFATVGFGDIHAVSQMARAAATLQMVGGLVLVGVIARVVVAAVQEGRRRQGKG